MEIQQSLEQILRRQEVVADLFYVVFLDRHPEVRRHFVGVDLKRQGVMLSMALMVMAHHHAHRYPATAAYLRVLGHQHHARRGVPASAFPAFRACLLDALGQFHGDDWDDPLAAQWGEAIDLATALMLEGYEGGHTA
jgi:hemoglobin-like flavoprotein